MGFTLVTVALWALKPFQPLANFSVSPPDRHRTPHTPLLICPPTTWFCRSPLHFRCYLSLHSLQKGAVHLHRVLPLDTLKTGDLHNLIHFKCIPLNHICSDSLYSFAQSSQIWPSLPSKNIQLKPITGLSYFP